MIRAEELKELRNQEEIEENERALKIINAPDIERTITILAKRGGKSANFTFTYYFATSVRILAEEFKKLGYRVGVSKQQNADWLFNIIWE